MKVWVVNRITQDLDGTAYFYRNTKVFTTETRAKEYYDKLYDEYYADEVIDDDENGVVFYEEDTIPRQTTLTIEEITVD